MKDKVIVTNLRIKKQDWLQVKTAAAELGMSVNQYVNFLIRDLTQKRQFMSDISADKSGGLSDLLKLAKDKNKAVGKLSKEDKLVYG